MKSKFSYNVIKYFVLCIIIIILLFLLLANGKKNSMTDNLLIGGSIMIVILIYHGIANMCEGFIFDSKPEQFKGGASDADVLDTEVDVEDNIPDVIVNKNINQNDIKKVSRNWSNLNSSDQRRIMSNTSDDVFYQNKTSKADIIDNSEDQMDQLQNMTPSPQPISGSKKVQSKKSVTVKRDNKGNTHKNTVFSDVQVDGRQPIKQTTQRIYSDLEMDDRQPTTVVKTTVKKKRTPVCVNKSENCTRETGDRITNEIEYSKYHNVPVNESQKFEYGYSFLDPEKWYPQPPYPPVCVTNNRCTVNPFVPPGTPYDLKEWNQSLRITPPDDINLHYIKEKLNSGK